MPKETKIPAKQEAIVNDLGGDFPKIGSTVETRNGYKGKVLSHGRMRDDTPIAKVWNGKDQFPCWFPLDKLK